MTSKGQVTIPIELRNKIGIKPGNYLEIKETEAGYVIQKQVDENCLENMLVSSIIPLPVIRLSRS